jgi:hypothetical protein
MLCTMLLATVLQWGYTPNGKWQVVLIPASYLSTVSQATPAQRAEGKACADKNRLRLRLPARPRLKRRR